MSPLQYHDRHDAGRRLGWALQARRWDRFVVVLGLARGGVVVAAEVAAILRAPLDVFVVRKLGVPGHEEYAMGAIASGGVRILNGETIRALNIPRAAVELVTRQEEAELLRRERAYRAGRALVPVAGAAAIVVDDGLATGASMYAAVTALRELRPASIIVAAPVAAPEAVALLRGVADDCVCLMTPQPLYGVGMWYEDFSEVSDATVRDLIEGTGVVT